ncbi:TPA: hypothetical protein BOS_22000 [Bos taurus]|nr:TPA: hypothetical protein BOS_22000 [Bos taurus]
MQKPGIPSRTSEGLEGRRTGFGVRAVLASRSPPRGRPHSPLWRRPPLRRAAAGAGALGVRAPCFLAEAQPLREHGDVPCREARGPVTAGVQEARARGDPAERSPACAAPRCGRAGRAPRRKCAWNQRRPVPGAASFSAEAGTMGLAAR